MRSLKLLIPNGLTFLRLFFGIGIIWMIFLKNPSASNFQLAGVLLLFALFLDLIDGPIARKLKAVTQFGYYLDHIIDFVLLVPIFFVLLNIFGEIVFCLFLILEIGVLLVSLLKLFGRTLGKWPNNPGRISFGILGVSASLTMLFYPTPFWPIISWPALGALILAILLRILSFHQAIIVYP